MKARLRKFCIFPALIAVVFIGTLAMQEYAHTHPAEPEHCALCDREYTIRAPALLNLATGEIAEMEVYATDLFSPDGIDKARTGFMRLSTGAGVQVCMSAGYSASVILPDKVERMDYSLYCWNCRALLSAVGTRGYVIVDLHDLNNLAAYPTREGMECTINGYTTRVHKKTILAIPEGHVDVMEVLVTGDE